MDVTARFLCLILGIIVWIVVVLMRSQGQPAKIRLEIGDAICFFLIALYLGQR